MNGYSVNGHKMNSSEGGVDSNVEVQSLREELDRVNAEFLKVRVILVGVVTDLYLS